jgi:hypothetical protein
VPPVTVDPAVGRTPVKTTPGGPGRRVVTAILLVLLTAWAAVFLVAAHLPRGPRDTGLGGDFATFYTASYALDHGINAYDPGQLYRTERQVWKSQGLQRPTYRSYIRAGNPPALYWLLGPLTRVTYRQGAWIWVGFMEALLAIGFLAALAACRWRRRTLPLYAFLCMPQTLLAAYYGNVDAVVFAGLCGAVWSARRNSTVVGLLLVVAWLKPQYGLPLAAVCLLFLPHDRARAIIGFAGATAVGALLCAVTFGLPSLVHWAASLAGLSAHAGLQPDIVSLSGLYVYWLGNTPQHTLMAVTLVVAVGLTVWWWLRRGADRSILGSGWLWVLWLLATPLAHSHYEIVLAPVVLAPRDETPDASRPPGVGHRSSCCSYRSLCFRHTAVMGTGSR